MNPFRKRILLCLGAALVLALVLFTGASSANATDNKQEKKDAAPAQSADAQKYVGAEACKGCHEDLYKKFEPTPHWKTTLGKVNGIEAHGCESCHGPGADHINGGGDKTKIFMFKGQTAKAISERCLTCHQYGEEHANFARSVHKINDVSCVECHSIHHAKEPQYLLARAQPQLCFSCHLETKADFNRPFRHRVNEGLLKCTDCHNQHGGFLTKQLRATSAQDQICFKCHVDKAGPFVFEHNPVKMEGCMACHLPHGSANPRLLRRSQVNLLCLECHTLSGGGVGPIGPNHDQSVKYQSCTLCHSQIHGSNVDRVFFR
jgi:DmsE family decaheme c-type cytochrome